MATLQKPRPILACVQEACRQLALAQPAQVYGSLDETAALMGSVANLAGILLADAFNWQDLQKTLTITGDGVTTNFPLPADFGSIVDNTGWSLTIRRPVLVLNPQQWASVSAWLGASFYISPCCRLYQNEVQFISAPPVGSITFQYRMDTWALLGVSPFTRLQYMTQDTDVPQFDWLMMVLAIKVKFLEQKNMDTNAAQSDLSDRYAQLTQRDELAPTLSLSGGVMGGFRFLDGYNTSDTNFG